MFIIKQFQETDIDDVISLWEICDLTRPWNNPEIDILEKLRKKMAYFYWQSKMIN